RCRGSDRGRARPLPTWESRQTSITTTPDPVRVPGRPRVSPAPPGLGALGIVVGRALVDALLEFLARLAERPGDLGKAGAEEQDHDDQDDDQLEWPETK